MDTSDPGRGSGFLKTCFNAINALSGIGILSVPYALSQGGWLSLAILLAVAIISCYTAILLRRCVDSSTRIKNYTDIGEVAFGRRGRIAVATIMYVDLYLVVILFLIMEGDNLEKLFPGPGFRVGRLAVTRKQGFVLLATLAVLPTTWLRSLGKLAYLSLGGVLASAVLVAAVLWVGAFEGVGFRESGELVSWPGLPAAMSVYAFCFSGHPVMPKLYLGMNDRKMFTRVLVLCFGASTLGYGVAGVAGYLMYGAGTQSQVTLNLPPGSLSSKVAIYTTLVNPLTKYALFVAAIADAIEDGLRVGGNRAVSVAIRTALVVGSAVVALAVPLFGYVTMLTGALLSSSVAMLLPCVCYLKISSMTSNKPGLLQRLVCVGIIGLAVGIAAVGTYISLKDIIRVL
ncbi:hypothetical protein ACP4OV_025186 [Aristida adscensionis]